MNRPAASLLLAAFLVVGLVGCDNQLAPPAELTLQTKTAAEVLPAGAHWMMMVDLQELQRNEAFAEQLGGLDGVDARLQGFFDATGFDPATDLREVYAARTSDDLRAVQLVAYATFDRDRLQSYVDENFSGELERASYQGATIYRTREAGETFSFALPSDNMIVAAADESALHAMLDRLAGSGDALKDDAVLMPLVEQVGGGTGVWMIQRHLDTKSMAEGGNDPVEFAQLGRAIDMVAFGLRVEEAGLAVTGYLVPDEGVATDDLADLAKGAVAAMKTSIKDQGGEMLEMLDDVQVRPQQAYVRIDGYVQNTFLLVDEHHHQH